jgi:hypothetical protein
MPGGGPCLRLLPSAVGVGETSRQGGMVSSDLGSSYEVEKGRKTPSVGASPRVVLVTLTALGSVG